MKLTADEVTELKHLKPIKLWRYEEPTVEVGRKYTATGEIYTVLDIRVLTRGAFLKHEGKAAYEKRAATWPDEVSEIWMVGVRHGDWTDIAHLLTYSGTPGDGHGYTDQHMKSTMSDEPEAVAREELEVWAKPAREARDTKVEKRNKHRKIRAARDRLQKLVDGS